MNLGLGLGMPLRYGRRGGSLVSYDPFLPGEINDPPGEFIEPPIVVSIDDGIQFKGKKASGASGKFIYDIGVAAASTVYTMLYDPDFTQLNNQGRTAMVGFGLRTGNDFHLVGLKGDGAGLTGLLAYEVYGANKWNKTSGFTEVNGGAALGNQAGPIWVQLEVSSDGATYTLRSSLDGVTWTDEITDATASPFALLTSQPVFGIAVVLEAADAGPFTVDITLWQTSAAAGAEPFPDPGAFSFIGAMAKLSADAAGTFNGVAIAFDAEDRDTDTIHTTGGSNTRLTIPAALDGKLVIVHANVWISYTSLAGVEYKLTIHKNGSAAFDGAGESSFETIYGTQTPGTVQTQPIFVSAGDYFEVFHHVTSGSNAGALESDHTSFGIWVLG